MNWLVVSILVIVGAITSAIYPGNLFGIGVNLLLIWYFLERELVDYANEE